MTENMKNFLTKVSEDKALSEKISQLDKEELVVSARELGFELTEADFAQPEGEIAEGELDAVAGGYQRCYCIVGGGGKADSQGEACGCVAAGFGNSKVDGEMRCGCPLAGTGYESLREQSEDD